MNQLVIQHKPQFEQAINHLNQEVNALRIGRATPAMIENLSVEAYGAKVPLIQVASINSAGSNELIVQPWDKNNLKAIEKTINGANAGFNVSPQENCLRLNLPALSEERRKEIVKGLNEKIEHGRVIIRGLRDKIKEEIQKLEKNREISEDDKYRLQEELDEMTREYNEKIDVLKKNKEREIMTF